MKEETIKCNLGDCNNVGAKTRKMQVIFHAKQTEERCVEPYLRIDEINICDECMEKILKSGRYIHASVDNGV